MRNYLSTTLYYDANGSAAGVGGSGVWDHTSALWNTAADGSGNRVAWDGVSGVKSAVFGGVFGQVAIQSDVVVDSLSIQTPGYKIIGDHTLMFGSTGSITTAAGVDLRLSTKLSGSITISGDGVNAIILTRDVGRDNTNPSITVANGSLLRLSATQHLNALTLNAGAAARINQGGAKALVLNTLHIAGTLTTPTATLDVEDNAMIVTDANAAAQVFGWMVAGFGTGDWTGHGITSTIAANDPNGLLALGYANNIDLGASQFAGITLGNNDTIVKFTYYGDADLDGVVTLEDFSQFLYGYQQGGTPNWIDGDFDYSGTVTLEDFSLFLANHNTTPATPTYAIDGLDQTFTAGEEVTLSPRITNNIPLPAGTVFGWTVKQGNTTIATSTGADFAYKLDENIAPTTLEVDLCVNNDEDHIISKTMDVDTPAGWTVIYGFSNPDSEPTRWPGVVGDLDDHEWKHGPGKYTLLLNNLPKHSWLTGVPAIAADIQLSHPVLNSWPADSKLTIKYGEYTRTVHLYTGAVDGDLPEFMPHTANSITYSVELSGVDNSVNWFIGNTAVETFLPTVTLTSDKNITTEGESFVLTAKRTSPLTQSELDALTQSQREQLLPQKTISLVWSGETKRHDFSNNTPPEVIIIPAGSLNGTVTVTTKDDQSKEHPELAVVTIVNDGSFALGNPSVARVYVLDGDNGPLTLSEALLDGDLTPAEINERLVLSPQEIDSIIRSHMGPNQGPPWTAWEIEYGTSDYQVKAKEQADAKYPNIPIPERYELYAQEMNERRARNSLILSNPAFLQYTVALYELVRGLNPVHFVAEKTWVVGTGEEPIIGIKEDRLKALAEVMLYIAFLKGGEYVGELLGSVKGFYFANDPVGLAAGEITEGMIFNSGGRFSVRPGATPTIEELEAAITLADNGIEITLKPPIGQRSPSGNTADAIIKTVGENRPYDIYTPETNNANSVFQGIVDKNGQAQGVILDLRKTSVTLSDLPDLITDPNIPNLREIIVINLDGTITRLLKVLP